MPSSRPFVLLGQHALDSLRERANAALSRWASHWVANAARFRVDLAAAAGSDEPLFKANHFVDGTGSVWIASGDRLDAAVAAAALGEPLAAAAHLPGDWSRAALRRAIHALQSELSQALLLGEVQELPTPSVVDRTLFAAGSGGVRFSCAELGLEAWACSAVLRHVPPKDAPRPAEPPIEPLAHGITHQRVALSVRAGSVDVELGHLLSLHAGDVLRLPTRLTDPLWLETPDGASLARCTLGELAGLRAVLISAQL
jgi:flagellar motor switch/type III secretory pathway protein FliN